MAKVEVAPAIGRKFQKGYIPITVAVKPSREPSPVQLQRSTDV
jgi:hypothetical protein